MYDDCDDIALSRSVQSIVEEALLLYILSNHKSIKLTSRIVNNFKSEDFLMKCSTCKIPGIKIGMKRHSCPKCGKTIEAVKAVTKKDKKK